MKKLIAMVLAMVLVLLVVAPALAKSSENAANDQGQSGESNVQTLYLYEKDSNWAEVWGGGWGKAILNVAGAELEAKFNGHGLVPGTDYTLVVYLGWPNVVLLGSGIANKGGNISIVGSANTGDLNDAKIWLVTSSDLTGSAFNAWNPGDYLFEHNTIDFDDTDV